MNHSLCLLAAVFAPALSLLAQEAETPRFSFSATAGITITSVSDFDHTMIVAPDGLVIPNYIHPSNSAGAPIYIEAEATTQALPGWYAEGEVRYRLPNNFGLSFSVGVKKLRFDYETVISYQDFDVIYLINLDDLHSDYGRTSLLYFNVAPFNLSKGLMGNRLSLQIGPTFNWLLKDETINTLAVFTDPDPQYPIPDKAYFDSFGEAKDLTVGINVGASFRITGPLLFALQTQFYPGSLYEDNGLYTGLWSDTSIGKVNAFVLQGALTLNISEL